MHSHQEGKINYTVAVDGSDASHDAFLVVEQGLLRPQDNLIVCHVFNKEKTYLPFNMHAESIRQYYSALLT